MDLAVGPPLSRNSLTIRFGSRLSGTFRYSLGDGLHSADNELQEPFPLESPFTFLYITISSRNGVAVDDHCVLQNMSIRSVVHIGQGQRNTVHRVVDMLHEKKRISEMDI